MIFSTIFTKIPYSIGWWFSNKLSHNKGIALYCGDPIDWYVMRFLYDRIPNLKVIAKNNRVKDQLKEQGVDPCSGWIFPRVVIMTRHAFHKFPCSKILKIGMRHGPYHFKSMIDVEKYNLFDLYLFTSDHELEQAEKTGIKCGAVGGFPKLDPAFDGSITESDTTKLRKRLKFDERPVILFTATWKSSGLSAVDKWFDRLGELVEDYNILVTLHPWIGSSIGKKIDKIAGVHLIRSYDLLPYLLLADLMVGDTSSILAEFSALKKPIVTFKISIGKRLDKELSEIISKISRQIEEFDDLKTAIQDLLANRSLLSEEQEKANRRMFRKLDGRHAENSFEVIRDFIRSQGMTI